MVSKIISALDKLMTREVIGVLYMLQYSRLGTVGPPNLPLHAALYSHLSHKVALRKVPADLR